MLDHPAVKLLDGGVKAWLKTGRPLARIGEVTKSVPVDQVPPTPLPFRGGRRLDYLATRFDVDRAVDDDATVIVDVRRASEYKGTEKRASQAGTVPGAVHVFWRDHLDENGALRSVEEVKALYETKGVTPDKNIIVFCQRGYRSANTFIVLASLGYPQVRNYMGSWAEWGNRDESRIILPD